MSATQDYVALDWIKGEIAKTLEQAQFAEQTPTRQKRLCEITGSRFRKTMASKPDFLLLKVRGPKVLCVSEAHFKFGPCLKASHLAG